MTPIAPLLICWLSGVVLIFLDGRRAGVCVAASVVLAGIAVGDAVVLARVLADGPYQVVTGHWPVGVGIRLRVDEASALFATIAAAVLACALTHEWLAEQRASRLPALVMLLAAGLHGAFFTGDMFTFYVFFELSIVSSFALAVHGYGPGHARGAFVYMVISMIGSLLLLVGVGALYRAAGTLDMFEMARRLAGHPRPALVAATLLFSALALKLGLFPMHFWVPVVYARARPAVAAALAGALGTLAAYGLLRFGYAVLPEARITASTALITLGALGAGYGGVLALRRRAPGETVAYAAVAHAGYIVLALGLGGPSGAAAIVLLAVSGALDKALAFCSLEAVGANRRSLGIIAAASLSGLPLTVGFLGKVQLVRAAVASDHGPLAVAVTAGVAILGFAYGPRFAFALTDTNPAGPRRLRRNAAAIALAAGVIALGTFATPVTSVAAEIAARFAAGGGQ